MNQPLFTPPEEPTADPNQYDEVPFGINSFDPNHLARMNAMEPATLPPAQPQPAPLPPPVAPLRPMYAADQKPLPPLEQTGTTQQGAFREWTNPDREVPAEYMQAVSNVAILRELAASGLWDMVGHLIECVESFRQQHAAQSGHVLSFNDAYRLTLRALDQAVPGA